MQDFSIVHLYPGVVWHGDAYVVGEKTGLLRLREAIDRALEEGVGVAPLFVNDGEGHDCFVICTDENTIHSLAVPYTDEIARDQSESSKWPHQLFDGKNFPSPQEAQELAKKQWDSLGE